MLKEKEENDHNISTYPGPSSDLFPPSLDRILSVISTSSIRQQPETCEFQQYVGSLSKDPLSQPSEVSSSPKEKKISLLSNIAAVRRNKDSGVQERRFSLFHLISLGENKNSLSKTLLVPSAPFHHSFLWRAISILLFFLRKGVSYFCII